MAVSLYDDRQRGSWADAVFPQTALYGSPKTGTFDAEALDTLRQLLALQQGGGADGREAPGGGGLLGGGAPGGAPSGGAPSAGGKDYGYGSQGATGVDRALSFGYDPSSLSATVGGALGGLFGPVGSMVGTQLGAVVGGSRYDPTGKNVRDNPAVVGPMDRRNTAFDPYDPTAVSLGLAGYGAGPDDRGGGPGGPGAAADPDRGGLGSENY